MANEYWAERMASAQDKLTQKNIKEVEAQLAKYYSSSMQRVIEQFISTYEKLIADAVNRGSITPADLYKLDKYWNMQAQLSKELNKLGEKELALLSDRFTKEFIQIYREIAIKDDLYFGTIDYKTAQQMINQIWCADGKSWSSRVWNNISALQEELNDKLIECVVAGRKTTELKEALMERFGVNYSRADALVRTEMAHIQTQAAQQRYKDYGITEVQVWASKDERRCEVCGKLHEKKYPINAQMPVPAHPKCRCAIIPVVD